MTHNEEIITGTVFFIGAGPGAPDLITLRGQRLIERAACIIYAGSLVNPALFAGCKAPLHDSAGLHLEEIVELMVNTCRAGGDVARVHTGDPCLYGAIKEQMAALDAASINYEIVPGVSSAFGAAAALEAELTLPEVSQSVIITRRGGRTPVPEAESLASFAAHRSTMVIFLSVAMIDEVVSELTGGGYEQHTPVSVVMKATWPDQKIVTGTLADIAEKVRTENITKTALICVGQVFGQTPLRALSKLYDKSFSHAARNSIDGDRGETI